MALPKLPHIPGLPSPGNLKLAKPYKKRGITSRTLTNKGMTLIKQNNTLSKFTNLMKNAHLPGDPKGTGKLV